MVSGKPIAIRLSCGAARLRTASARLVIIKATTTGSARSSPEEKTIAPSACQFPPAFGVQSGCRADGHRGEAVRQGGNHHQVAVDGHEHQQRQQPQELRNHRGLPGRLRVV
jgi:hypothetical protein